MFQVTEVKNKFLEPYRRLASAVFECAINDYLRGCRIVKGKRYLRGYQNTVAMKHYRTAIEFLFSKTIKAGEVREMWGFWLGGDGYIDKILKGVKRC
jgi:hypothetical protein